MMNRIFTSILILSLLLVGCVKRHGGGTEIFVPTNNQISTRKTRDAANNFCEITPLPNATMENLTDAILSVSFAEGDAYVDDTGKMQMNLKIYTYDKYDMIDIANLKVGNTIIGHTGAVEVISVEQDKAGRILINGGLDADGFNLATDDDGVFYEIGYNDAKNWYQIGEATIRVSVDFKGIDNSDLDLGEVILYPGDFLIGAVTNYDFTPYNTTIRVENGQIVELNRRYIP